jgi:hypothetical protein
LTVEGVHGGAAVSRTWLACDRTPGRLIAVSTSDDFLYDLICAENPILGVYGGFGSHATPALRDG